MQERFPNEEMTWDYAAKMALHPSSKMGSTAKERYGECVRLYREAVKTLNTEKMWTMYIETLIDVQCGTQVHLSPKYKPLFDFQHNEAVNVSDNYFQQWLEKLRKDLGLKEETLDPSGSQQEESAEDLALKKFGKKWLGVVLKEATVNISGSVTLWELRMRMHLVWDEVGEATAILDEANLALQGDAALPLWQHMLLYWLANDPTKHKVRVNEFLKKASNMENQPAICNHFRVIWLGWIVLKMAKRSPPCLQLHHKMIEYEKMQEDCNEACLRIYYVLACIHFGTDNKEIWLDYFRFEKEYGKPGQMGDLYNDACSYLNKSLVEQFKEEYNQLNK